MTMNTNSEIAKYKLNAVFGDNTVTHRKLPRTEKIDVAHTTTTGEEVWVNEKVLGAGTFGIVSRQIEKDTGQLRAVKVISKAHSATQELATLVNLRDDPDHFVMFLGWFEDTNSIHIVMEYIAHGDLDQYMTEHPQIVKDEAKQITRQLLEGLVVLHDRQICHRDLKPQNILVASRDPIVVKITDFGISKLWSGTSLRTYCGTPCYQAPEQLGLLSGMGTSNSNSYSNAIDIWALGAMIHQMLTTNIPFMNISEEVPSSDFDPNSWDFTQCRFGTRANTLNLDLLVDYCRRLEPFPCENLSTEGVSRNGIAMIMVMMAAQPLDRGTAATALQNIWLGGTVFELPVFHNPG